MHHPISFTILHESFQPLFKTTPRERNYYHPIPQGRKLRLRDSHWLMITQLGLSGRAGTRTQVSLALKPTS